ncbi:hypothetical protein U1Q18_002704, partial [Sarracenia purpurea var. burkii]
AAVVSASGSKAVINRDNNSEDFSGEATANGVVGLSVSVEVDKSVTVEEDDWEVFGGNLDGDEGPTPEVARRINRDVEGLHVVDRLVVGRSLEIEEIKEGAVDSEIVLYLLQQAD